MCVERIEQHRDRKIGFLCTTSSAVKCNNITRQEGKNVWRRSRGHALLGGVNALAKDAEPRSAVKSMRLKSTFPRGRRAVKGVRGGKRVMVNR